MEHSSPQVSANLSQQQSQQSFLPHPNASQASLLDPGHPTKQYYPSQEQQPAKRSPESDDHFANKRSRTDKNSQILIHKSEDVDHQQTASQTQFTSPTTATSAYGTPAQPLSDYPQGTPQQPGYYPLGLDTTVQSTSLHPAGTSEPSYPSAMQGTSHPSYSPGTQGLPPPGTLETSQPGYPPGTQGHPPPVMQGTSPGTQGLPSATQGTSHPPGTQGHPPPAMQGTSPGTQGLSSATQGTSHPPGTQGLPSASGKSGNKTVTVKNKNEGDGAAQANKAGDSKDQKVGQADKAGGSGPKDKKVSLSTKTMCIVMH